MLRPFRYLFCLSGLLLSGSTHGAQTQDAPSLSVNESAYGTVTREGHHEDISHLDLRIVSYSTGGAPYRVECFFLKPGKHGGDPVVDDAVGFDVADPHATYRVEAKPITIKEAGKAAKGGKVSGKPKAASTHPPQPRHPTRAGYVVRISRQGCLLKEVASDHALGQYLSGHSPLLENVKVRALPAPPLCNR